MVKYIVECNGEKKMRFTSKSGGDAYN
ncbi:hypothetical protein [Candidatus Photodesmus katoptron]